MTDKIWALLSVDNNYDQPENNLVAWWLEKPSFDVLAKAVDLEGFPCKSDDLTIRVVNLWQGASAQTYPDSAMYRLVLIPEGKL